MEKLLALAVVCALVGVRSAQSDQPCADVNQGADPNKIPLPTLPTTQFKAVVRAEIVNKNMTVESTEYVDENLNMAAMKIVQEGTTGLVLMSYSTNEVFYLIPDAHAAGPLRCIRKVLSTDDISQMFGMRADPSSKIPHMYSTSKILNFINGTEVYKGQTTISGVRVNHWSSCVYWSQLQANFTLDFYFTVPGWKTPSGLDQIPVRAEVRGHAYSPNNSHDFHHIYQYVNFDNYVNDPETVFATPPGVICLTRNSTKPLPKLGQHFSYREEVSAPRATGVPTIDEVDFWYDNDLQLIRYDQRDAPQGASSYFPLSTGPFTIIHDYTVGVQYAIAKDTGACSIDPIPVNAKGLDAVYNITRQHLGMRGPARFFNLDKGGYVYAGKRSARGQQCDVFQNLITDLPGQGPTVYEVYFLSGGAQDITDMGSSGDHPSTVIPMRIMEWRKGQLADQIEIYDFDQDAPMSNTFDVTPCFPGQKSIDFEMYLSVSDTNLMPTLAPYLKQLLTLEVSVSSGISPVRLQKTRLHWNRWGIYYQGTILDAAPALAKFEQSLDAMMPSAMARPLQNIYSDSDCAAQCDNLQEWMCVQFDYCSSTKVCSLGKYGSVSTLVSMNSCSHYRRVLGGGFDKQTPLSEVWGNLKNNVYRRQVVIPLALPDSDGKVDISADTSKLDSNDKLTFTALWVTNEVVSSVNRNPTSASVMTKFQTIPNMVGKGSSTVLRGVSVDDCASNCVGELTYNCQSFHYCWEAGTCFLSKLHPDERPDQLKNSSACDLYYRDYTSNFQKFPGMTVLSSSNTVYQDVTSASQCAKLCTYYSANRCESFDFCTDVSACYLGQTHYFDAPRANIKQAPSCAHYSRDYIQDFVLKENTQVQLRDNRVIQGVTPAQCAKLCVEEGGFTCNSFDYCGNFTECRLSDAMVSGVGQVTLQSTAYCSVYIRQYGTKASGQGQGQTGNGGNSGRYTGGAMGGLAMAMIALGLILGVVLIVLYTKLSGRQPGDGMTVAFSKHEMQDS